MIEISEDLTYYVDYDENRSSCRCSEEYCRCTTVDPVVTKIDNDRILKLINKKLNKIVLTDIQKYCIERCVFRLRVQDFLASGISGYYGEEVKVSLINNAFVSNINYIINHSNTECIEFILTNEYGYLLPELKNKEWEILKVNIENVHPPFVRLDDKTIAKYSGKEYVLCRYVDGTNYNLIDGNHRFAAAIRNKLTSLNIIVNKE